jgi:AraC family transcriptional regulator of adaptative response / DNA-3-methyladenine glycosylase II
MDFDERYRIIQSRDARFDGQFITAVRTTGIYCRPSCPARTPKPSNVTFFETSAAAHEAGYRACKRCLPEAVPGTPAWNLRGDLAGRAMRLIGDGVIEREGVSGLSSRLGYSSRHLTRVLTEELGAGPLALSRAVRAQTARSLLTSTDLSMSDIAFAAGFSSIRQFNDTVHEVFELTPTEVRARNAGSRHATPGSIRLALPYREPFDAAGVFAWLAARAVPGVEIARADSYTRSIALPGGPAWFTVRAGAARLDLEAHLTALSDLRTLVSRIRRLFDLDADPVAIDDALSADPVLAERVRATPGIRMPGAVDEHEMVFRAIVGQQISVAAARTHLHRLVVAAGSPLVFAFGGAGEGDVDGDGDGELGARYVHRGAAADADRDGDRDADADADRDGDRDSVHDLARPGEIPTLLFPTAAQIAQHADAVLAGPRAKTATVVAVARALASGDLTVSFGDDAAEQRARLVAFAGIGDWTAGYLAMRILGDPDVFLPGDVAVRTGARALGWADAPRALTDRAAAFSPWRSYLCLHLWRAAVTPVSASGATSGAAPAAGAASAAAPSAALTAAAALAAGAASAAAPAAALTAAAAPAPASALVPAAPAGTHAVPAAPAARIPSGSNQHTPSNQLAKENS